MTITVGENTYVTVDEFTDYCAARGVTVTEGDEEILLIRAMDYLSIQNWKGDKTDEDQDLDFPRDGETDVPEKIKKAQMELGIIYGSGEDPTAPVGRAVKREKVDVIEVEYDDKAAQSTRYPYITAILRPYLYGSALNARVVRV